MNQRLKLLRRELKLNQENFGKKVSLSRTAVANMEIGHRAITDRTIQLICSTFHVNEDWLRHGQGTMFHTANNLLELMGLVINDMSEGEKDFVTKFLSMPSEDRKNFVGYLTMVTPK